MTEHHRHGDSRFLNTVQQAQQYTPVEYVSKSDVKRLKLEAVQAEVDRTETMKDRTMLIQFTSEEGEVLGAPVEVPHDTDPAQLRSLVNTLLENDDESTPFSFFVEEREVVTELSRMTDELGIGAEAVVSIIYQPQAVFKVRAISQCSATIRGHADNIVELYFSPDGSKLASGSGDQTVRFWDIYTQTPKMTCKAHKHWVQCIAWSPDGTSLASGGLDNMVVVWDPETGAEKARLLGHRQRINWISWEPLHLAPKPTSTRLASASKDGSVRVWDYTKTGTKMVCSLGSHTKSVTCVKWGGSGLLYTASQDRMIFVWKASDGTMVRQLKGHAHWVNSLSLSTDYVIRTGPFNHRGVIAVDGEADLRKVAQSKYDEAIKGRPELCVSGSEDNTMYIWDGANSKKPVGARITGHQKPIMYVSYSPDGRYIASGSNDKSCKIWDGRTGKFMGSLRGHVGPVYRLTWAPDSRMVVTASEDSTMKLWNLKTYKMSIELPGHSGSVYACDWAPNGATVASGGADKTLKLWKQ